MYQKVLILANYAYT